MCSFFYLAAQKTVDSTYLEEFKYYSSWPVWNDKDAAAAIDNDNYIVEHRRNINSWAFWNYIDVDYSKNYSIEIPFEQISGVEDYGHGIIWGYKDWNNYNSFLITPNGYVNINITENGKYVELQEWKQNSAVKASGVNKLLIERKEETINFYVNDVLVLASKSKNFKCAGKYVGALLYKDKKIKIDYLKISGTFRRLNLISDPIKGYKKENLGQKINSITPDLGPVISPDGKTLYYFRKRHPKNIGGEADDAWYSVRNDDGTWSETKNMGFPVNNSSHNFVVSVSADNNTLYVINTYNKDGSPKGQGLSVSHREGNKWSVPLEIEIKNFYNNNQYVNFCLSQDNMYLIQAIERKDTRGDADIYVSIKNANGTYSEPMNLGDVINTVGYETTPFLAADNKTLYFSSNGHPGYGSNDVFVTYRLDDTWKKWTTPLNLGPEINSADWDAYFTIPASGEVAYMVSSHNSFGEGDIVKIKLPEAAKPKPVVLIKGKVLNKKTNEALGAVINYYDTETNAEVGAAISNAQTGDYNIILQYGKKYSFRADKEGYYAVNDFLDVSELKEYKEIEKDLFLVPVEIGQVVRLNNIFFDFNKADLKNDSFEELDRLVSFLNKNKKIEIEISGHTDNVGSDDYNQKLSQQRVESVVAYLVSKGIDKARLQAKGYGKIKPVVSNDTDEGRATNRRVEFTILKQ